MSTNLETKRLYEAEGRDVSTIPTPVLALLVAVIAEEVAVGEFSWYDVQILKQAALVLTKVGLQGYALPHDQHNKSNRWNPPPTEHRTVS